MPRGLEAQNTAKFSTFSASHEYLYFLLLWALLSVSQTPKIQPHFRYFDSEAAFEEPQKH